MELFSQKIKSKGMRKKIKIRRIHGLVVRICTWPAVNDWESHCKRKSEATRSSTMHRNMVKHNFARNTPETPVVANCETTSFEILRKDLIQRPKIVNICILMFNGQMNFNIINKSQRICIEALMSAINKLKRLETHL
jgi:hypothetical protein